MNYKHSLQLFKLYNGNKQSEDCRDINLNFNQSFKNRCDKVKFFDVSNVKIGCKAPARLGFSKFPSKVKAKSKK